MDTHAKNESAYSQKFEDFRLDQNEVYQGEDDPSEEDESQSFRSEDAHSDEDSLPLLSKLNEEKWLQDVTTLLVYT
ncbi:MAG: hypothetical protein HETSPECPRED_002134 [Heterodermia speciosa]|uniref:Uncharacterized protein n=1 Tax=Heterodermia speciosa TaxID=116794 RepID=A0A8H3J3E3_9LECA|nr:MAG: hypothetical protein HETSPECPRED_002134 [Heterodermia speciosa]